MPKPKKANEGVVYAQDSYLAVASIPHETPEDRARLAAAIRFWVAQMDLQKWPRALQWYTNFAFLVGNHYPDFRWNGTALTWSGATFEEGQARAQTHPLASLIPKTVDNHLIRPFEETVSLLTEARPMPRVEPNSDNAEDEEAAKIGELYVEVSWEEKRMFERQRAIAGALGICGLGAIEVITEETDIPVEIERMREVKRTNELVDDVDGSPLEMVSMEPTGEFDVRFRRDLQAHVWNGFHLTADPAATDEPDSMSWIIRATHEDIGWVRESFDRDEEGYFPDVLEQVGPEANFNSPLYWWERVKDVFDTPEINYGVGGYPYGASGNAPSQTVLRVLDIKPNRYYPRGRTIIMAGDQILYAQHGGRAWSEKYPWRWHPYSLFRYWQVPGRFWGIPLLTPLVPLQKRMNAIDALVQLNREYMTIGQWMIPTTARVPAGWSSGLPGQDMPYRPSPSGAKPEKVKHESMPGELLVERAQLADAIDTIAGTSRPLQGAEPLSSAVRAGVMLDFLKSERLRSKSATLQGYEKSLEHVAQQMLIEASISESEDQEELTARIRAAARGHSNIAIATFTGASLRDNVRVRIDIVSELLKSPEASQQKAIELIQFARERLTPLQFTHLLKKAGFEDLEIEQTPHYERARKMVARIVSGKPEFAVPFAAIDDPTTFAQVFQNAILDDKFMDYAQEIQQVLLQLFDYYRSEAQRQAQEAQKAQLMMMVAQAQAEQGIVPGSQPPEAMQEHGKGASKGKGERKAA
jgi:hypothetical protein